MNIPYERPLKTGLVATLRGTAPDAYREDGTPVSYTHLAASDVPISMSIYGEEPTEVWKKCRCASWKPGQINCSP